MSHLTRQPFSAHPDGPARSWKQGGARLLSGALAAGLGLALCAIVVLLLWIASPHPQGGTGRALHVAAALWLLAHGGGLSRTSTVTGEPVPVDLTPLLLLALPVWLIVRAVRAALDESGTRAQAGKAAAAIAAGYLLVGAAALHYAGDGPLRAEPLTAGAPLALTTLATAAAAAWLSLSRPPLAPREAGALASMALRAATLGATVLTGGGLVVVLAAVARHGGDAAAALGVIGGTWVGKVSVLLLTLALLPNAAVWAAAYGLGPGFTLGAGSVVGPLATTAYPDLPRLPLLAALPAEGPGTPSTWAAGALPLAAGAAVGVYVGRAAAPVPAPVPRNGGAEETLGPGLTAVASGAAAVVFGAALALLAGLGAGGLGTGSLAHLGPVWWMTGVAAFCWAAAVGLPTALAVRAWRLRERGSVARAARFFARSWRRYQEPRRAGDGAFGGEVRDGGTEGAGPQAVGPPRARAGEWHDTGARRTRWAALKEASGGLMADFPARGRGDSGAD